MDLTALLPEAVAVVLKAGGYQMSRFRQGPAGGGDEKLTREYVSEVDLRSEQILAEGLAALVPEAGFFGEETGRRGERRWEWIVDPLDGTTNYLSGLEQFAVSVALCAEGRPVLGVVYRPASQELFTATAGSGLHRNGQILPPQPDLPLGQALLGSGFPYRSRDLATAFFGCAEEVLYQCRGLRRMGSAALDLSYVAAGFLQGFWESDLQPYDVAAALLFLEEAGCTVTNEQGLPYDMNADRLLVCGRSQVHRRLLSIVESHYGVIAPRPADPA